MGQSSSWEDNSRSASEEFPHLWFITVFTRSRYWNLSWTRLIQSITSQHVPLRFILILSSELHFCLWSGLFPSGLQTKIIYAFFISLLRATCPVALIPLDLFTLMLGWSSSLYSSVHLPVTFCPLGPIWLSVICSLTPCYRAIDQLLHAFQKSGHIF